MPDFISLADLRFILSSLIREQVSIKDIIYVFEKINDYAEDSSKSDLLNKVRLALSGQLCKKYENEDGVISVFELSEKTVMEMLDNYEDDDNSIVKIDI